MTSTTQLLVLHTCYHTSPILDPMAVNGPAQQALSTCSEDR